MRVLLLIIIIEIIVQVAQSQEQIKEPTQRVPDIGQLEKRGTR